jgi:hypothetical protein
LLQPAAKHWCPDHIPDIAAHVPIVVKGKRIKKNAFVSIGSIYTVTHWSLPPPFCRRRNHRSTLPRHSRTPHARGDRTCVLVTRHGTFEWTPSRIIIHTQETVCPIRDRHS